MEDESENSNEDDTEGLKAVENIENECNSILEIIKKIIEFSKIENIIAIYLYSPFWINLIKEYDIPDWENIRNIHNLRKLYKEYNQLINDLYEKHAITNEHKNSKDNQDIYSTIKSDINIYYERDEFAFLLNKNIKLFFENAHKKIKNEDKLGTVEKYNPYFSIKDEADKEKYKYNRETYIFDYVDYNEISPTFIKNFHKFNFEEMFQENIRDYINKITEKITDVQTFGNILELIRVDEIKVEEKQKEYFKILEEKYKKYIKENIKTINDDKLMNKAIKIIAELISKIFLFEKNNNRFLDEEISSLDENIKSLIYIELITTYIDDKYKEQKNNIFKIYLEKIEEKEGRDNIIKLVSKLKDKDKNYFIYEKLLEKCDFTKEEFFSNNENYKIQTIYLLNEELKKEQLKLNILEIKDTNKAAANLISVLDNIKNELENGQIIKKDLEKFLNIKKSEENEENKINISKQANEENDNYSINKLDLITLILDKYDPQQKYYEYKKKISLINEKVNKLKFIKEHLMIFHRNLYHEDINKITKILDDIEKIKIKDFNAEKTTKEIEHLSGHEDLCKEIQKVKDFLLFKKIFENAQGKDQADRFTDANDKLKYLKLFFKKENDIEKILNDKNYKDTFRDIKEDLGKKSEEKSKEFMKQMKDYLNFEKESQMIKDLKLIINSKKYEKIVKSIKYFFDNFQNKKLNLPNNINLSDMNLKDLKLALNQLKTNDIYDYEENNPYYKVFTSIYEKKEAIDFLISKINTDNKELENKLKQKLDPTNRSISVEDIADTINCLIHIKNLINKKEYKEIIKYIKELAKDNNNIKIFENYSKKFGSIIELDNNEEKDRFEKVYNIINDASLLFDLDGEDFFYKDNEKIKKIDKFEELIIEKNKITLQQKKIKEEEKKEVKDKKEEENKEEKKEKDIFEDKCDKLIFFKDIISNLEIIYDKIDILRKKGFNIPIVINIIIKYPNVTYKLYNKEQDFNHIKNYLFEVKNDYDNQISNIYENEQYSRILYGKLFRKVKLHQDGSCEIPDIIRYILNKVSITNNEENKIKEVNNFHIKSIGEDFERGYSEYTKNIFGGISEYLADLFKVNNLSLSDHYKNMLIKSKNDKGIEIEKCKENDSMEYYIYSLFMEKLNKLPIAQNIIICSNETSIEEIQSFLNRAILCPFNTLFMVEILESFTNFQINKMYNYINKLLLIQFENKKKNNKKIDISNPSDYLESFIVFVYKKLDNENAFENELGKYSKKERVKRDNNITHVFDPLRESQNINMIKSSLDNLNTSSISNINNIQEDNSFHSSIHLDSDIEGNIKVISSDACGLGKSFKIIKEIREKNKRYYHFPLGGKLTKSYIYEKISNLFRKIKSDSNIANKDIENNSKNLEDCSFFNNVAIHLDLLQTKETSLINEFLFSFLITKFYMNNENIIYIPNNIKIYIEVPNSFENYLTKYGILKKFNRENIILGELKLNEIDIRMLPLELEENIRNKFKLLNGFEDDTKIENFIKESFKKLNIKEYSYHQIQTFIKLYIELFHSFKGKLKFKNSKGEDETKTIIDHFVNSTKYFLNGGFAKLIMEKQNIEDKVNKDIKYKIYDEAYKNELKDEKFENPLIFINKDNKYKYIYERLPEKVDNIGNKKDVDIVYIIDATGSMSYEIKAAKEHVFKIYNELKENYEENDFQFGAVFYRDNVYNRKNGYRVDINECFPLTKDIKDLEEKISRVTTKGGGGDGAEDWAGGYELALKNMKWRNGIKLIIHICDDGAHGEQFTPKDPFFEEGEKLISYIKECVEKNINIIGFKIGKEPETSYEKIKKIYNDYYDQYKKTKDNGQFIEIYDFHRGNQNEVSNNFKKLVMLSAERVINPSYKYLKKLKTILNIPNDLEKLLSILNIGIDNYVITDDNYRKMLLLVYRIKANLPVIIMGETGCGKTSLIKKLSQLLNNGEEFVQIINIDPGITNEKIADKMEEMNNKAKSEKYKGKELWVFFDEINTCLSFSLLTEIFVNRTFNGIKLEDNIRLIGACNPYRKRNESIERCGLTREDDEDDQLVYKVEELPQSLLYYVFSFGSLEDNDEKKYIKSIIHKIFMNKKQLSKRNREEEKLHNLTTEAISLCHQFLRKSFGNDPSIVSLREIARFKTCFEFFQDYFIKKDDFINGNLDKNDRLNKTKEIDEELKKVNKIKSIICSIYLCYYIRLTNEEIRKNFENHLRKTLLDIGNVYCEGKKDEQNNNDLKYQRLRYEFREKNFKNFSELLKNEEDFLLDQIELDNGLGKNQLLKENLFLLFLALVTKIPLIIVGKPGTGKSLSAQLINNSMRGKYSKPKNGKKSFFTNYPKINQIYYQGSTSTTPEEIEKLFEKTEEKYNIYKKYNKIDKENPIPIYMILFDELGLAEKSPTNPLKVLHSKLEYTGTRGICFVGISNYSLDAAKVNRALNLSVPNLEEKIDQLNDTAKSIVENISDEIYNKSPIFYILSLAYSLYKQKLNFIKELMVLKQYCKDNKDLNGKTYRDIKLDKEFIKLLKRDKKIKTEFHGNRDFYGLIKGVAKEGSKLNNIADEKQIVPIINDKIERNFGGIIYDIDIDFNLEFKEIMDEMIKLKEILKDFIENKKVSSNRDDDDDDKDKKIEKKDNTIKFTSVFLFKKIYNEACIIEKSKEKENITGNYQISDDESKKYNINKCIQDNINDINSRYLLLEIKSNLSPLINQIIRVQNPLRNNKIDTIIGSPFPEDKNNNYKYKKINEIQNCASQEDKLIILQNLDQIQPYLYDLYNMNYKVIDDQRYVRICLDNFSEQLTPVIDSFKMIILVEKAFVNKIDMAFLNRLEKIKINFKDLLKTDEKDGENKDLKKLIDNIQKNENIKFKEEIKAMQNKINYDLENLLINCKEQDIIGLVNYLYLETKKENRLENNKMEDLVYDKISNLLPQDIAVILSENNLIKKKCYTKKKYYNFKEYILALNTNDKDLNNYTISIIYTFSNITSTIKMDNCDEFMISTITTENKLNIQINDIKNKNKRNNNNHYILIRFEDSESNKLQFTVDYILNYCKDENYHYILIIHLQRYMNSDYNQKRRIYSVPNIYNNINQIFIDNLDGPNIKLNDLFTKDVKEIFSLDVFNSFDKELRETLTDFVYDKMSEKNANEISNSQMSDLSIYLNKKYGEKSQINNSKEENYCNEIIKYILNYDTFFKDKIIEKTKDLIGNDNIYSPKKCKDIVNKMLENNYINKDKIDIISCTLDYIKENIFKKNLRLIFDILEDNNFLTTLLEINDNKTCKLDKNDNNPIPNNSKIIQELETKFLNEIKVDNKEKYEPKFRLDFHYKVPGFYNFYKEISNYLANDISIQFYNNEKKLRDIDLDNKNTNLAQEIETFHEKEEELLQKVLKKIENYKLYNDLINKITPDLILNDYITFYLEKYLGIYSRPFFNIISLLLDLRFSDEKNIIKNNIDNQLNIVLIKIMWIESNTNYIEGLLKAFEYGKDIYNIEGSDFYLTIYNIINDQENPIKYKVNNDRPEHLKEVNECFYLFLAGLCLSVSINNLEKMKISIGDYYGLLKYIFKIVKNIDNDLNTYIYELFIIDELIKILDYNPNTKKKTIIDIRYYLVENAYILEKNQYEKNIKLKNNFNKMNESLKNIENEKKNDKYYSTLKYVYKKEILKICDDGYRAAILEEIIKEKDIIKISNDIFTILLESYEDLDEKLIRDLLKSKNIIIKLLNKKLSDENEKYYLALSETMIYYFERNVLVYLKDFSKNVNKKLNNNINEGENTNKKEKKKCCLFAEEGEHLKIFKECIEFLCKFGNNLIDEGNKFITLLFCIAYIKSFCYIFIKLNKKKKIEPDNIIEIINENDKLNMVKLYIYRTIYNKNHKQINVFTNKKIKKRYKLEHYEGFKKFIKEEDIKKLEQFTYDKNKSAIFEKLKEYEENQFKEKIKKDDINIRKKDFDDFYMAAYKLVLSKLKNKDLENDESYINFFSNVCEPIFKNDCSDNSDESNQLFTILKYFFDKDTYLKIKEEESIDSEDIDALLYGYRYCLNEVKSKGGDFIYSYLYDINNRSSFDKKFYPGGDNNNEPYYDLYNKIVNHFNEKPDEGCYVCLCDKGYYHSVTSGFPGVSQLNMKCELCGAEIGAKESYREEIDEKDGNKVYNIMVYDIITSNSHYYRIFKDEQEIKDSKIYYREKFENMNYMTLQEFRDNYIKPLYLKEKGLNKIDINSFNKENKKIRNLSQISYRLLNYILYCHLFYAKLYTQGERFDKYLPEGISWFNMIKECFNKLKVELNNQDIKNIEIFMNCVFNDLFEKLHNQKTIDTFEELVNFEDKLEELIKTKCKYAKEEIKKFKELEKEILNDEKSAISLIKEIYDESKYKNTDFQFYRHFYFTDYLDENYIDNILEGKDKTIYPVLNKYLQNKNQNQKSKDEDEDEDNNEDNFSLDKLYLFNKVLNLFKDIYLNQITKELAEKQPIKTSEIYRLKENAKLIDDFIKFYNDLKIEDDNGNKLELNVEKNCIIDFLIIDDNKYGKSYKAIYKIFIDKQNNELGSLLHLKISSGELNPNCQKSINVQEIKENEIFSFTREKENSKILFNSSYRKYIDTRNHENYNEYEIRLKQIESEMTTIFLENKKLLHYNIKDFYFNNEVFSYEINDLISDFKYNTMNINNNDKEVIYRFIQKHDGNIELYKTIINNFITLIKYLNKVNEDKNNKINGSTKIYDIEIVKNIKNISKDFKELFSNNTNSNVNLNVSKITNIFDYFLKLIYKDVKKDIEKHQEKNMNAQSAYNYNDKDKIIKKGDLASAVRKFITLVLFREKENDKDKKIKSNTKNIIDYLKKKDLWDSLYNKLRFEEDLTKLKDLNIKIKEILFFYNYLINYKDEGFDVEIKDYIKKKEDEEIKKKKTEKKLKQDKSDSDSDSDDSDDGSADSSDEDSDNDSNKKKPKKDDSKNKKPRKNEEKHEEEEEEDKKKSIKLIQERNVEKKKEEEEEDESESDSEDRRKKPRKKKN